MLLIKNYHISCKLGNGETHGGHHRGHWTPPMMSDALVMMGGITYHCKTSLNIDIYPSTLFFFENIGHKYDFEGGWGGPNSNGWLEGVVQLKENKLFPPNKFIFTYY